MTDMNICTTQTTTIAGVLSGKTRFVIPDYQRSYDWMISDRVNDLFEDLIMSRINNETQQYILGPIVTEHDPGSKHTKIIDGQQRLVTLVLWFCALRDYLKPKRSEINSPSYDSFIKCLTKSIHVEGVGPIIKLNVQEDNKIFEDICKGEPVKEAEQSRGNIYSNYNALLGDTEKAFNKIFEEYSPGEAVEKIREIFNTIMTETEFIHVQVNDKDFSYQVFQSLNSKGQILKQTDLIKSHFLEMFKHDIDARRERDVEWTKVVDSDMIKDPDDFVFYSLLSRGDGVRSKDNKTPKDLQKRGIYTDVKMNVKTQNDVIEYMKNFETDSKIYIIMKNPEKIGDEKTINKSKQDEYLHILYGAQQIRAKYFLRTMMAAYREWGVGNPNTFKLFDCLVKFFFMYRSVAKKDIDLIKSISNKVTIDICNDSDKKLDNDKKLHRVICTILKHDGYVTIEKKEFVKEFAKKVTNLDGKTAHYILYSIEHKLQKERGVLPSGKGYELEHIFPKKPTRKQWPNLGDLENYKDDLGNLTLLDPDWNKTIKNRSYEDKRSKGDKCYKKSGVYLNKKYLKADKWDMMEIRKRRKNLLKESESIWDLSEYIAMCEERQSSR